MCDTSTYQNKGVIMKIMGVFLSISNMNSTINPDAAAENRRGWWTGSKALINVSLIPYHTPAIQGLLYSG